VVRVPVVLQPRTALDAVSNKLFVTYERARNGISSNTTRELKQQHTRKKGDFEHTLHTMTKPTTTEGIGFLTTEIKNHL